MENGIRQYNVFDDEEFEEILAAWEKLPSVVRAEKIIRQYLLVEHKTEGLTKQFEDWLGHNALAALQTEAIGDYFDFVMFGNNSIPATDPDRVKQVRSIIKAAT